MAHSRYHSSHKLSWAWMMFALSYLELIATATQSNAAYTVYHRVAPLSTFIDGIKLPWTSRATLELAFVPTPGSTAFEILDHPPITVSSFFPHKSSPPLTLPSQLNATLYYQLSIVPSHAQPPPEDLATPYTTHPISSSPLCALDVNTGQVQEYFNLWIRPKSIRQKSSLTTFSSEDHDLLGINWATSKRCITASDPSESDQLHHVVEQRLASLSQWKSRLSVRRPESLPQPVLRPFPTGPAPQILPDGTMKAPPKEQGWLAKYWMYILPVVVMLLIGGGGAPEEEGPAGGAPQATKS